MNADSHGRVRQRQRTLTTLLDAAVELMAEGRTPTIAETAERAEISRATAYRYFASQDAMLREAALHGAVPDITGALATIDSTQAVEERLALLVQIVNRWVTDRESGFRVYLRQSLDPSVTDTSAGDDDGSPAPRRGGRRIAWIEEALAPVRSQMDPERFRDLAGALSLFLGIETKIVLKDIWEMDDEEAERVALWATRALLREALLPDEDSLPAT